MYNKFEARFEKRTPVGTDHVFDDQKYEFEHAKAHFFCKQGDMLFNEMWKQIGHEGLNPPEWRLISIEWVD